MVNKKKINPKKLDYRDSVLMPEAMEVKKKKIS
jgi:hypothetical protein